MTNPHGSSEPAVQYPVTPYAAQAIALPAEPDEIQPLKVAKNAMRGRYKWAVLIGTVLAAGGAYVGWNATQPLYQAAGLVNVAPRLPVILYQTDSNGAVPQFDSFVEAEGDLLASGRVVNMAMQSPEWQELGRGNSDEAKAEFVQSVAVNHRARTNTITVLFSDRDPAAAQIGVNQILAAYMKLVEERDADIGIKRRRILERERQMVAAQLSTIREDILSHTDGLGTQAIDAAYETLLGQLNHYEAKIMEKNLERIGLEALVAGEGQAGSEPAREPTNEEIAATDGQMHELLVARLEAEQAVEFLGRARHLGPMHPEMLAAKEKLALLDGRIALRRAEALALSGTTTGGADLRLATVSAELDRYARQHDNLVEKVQALSRKRIEIQKLLGDEAVYQQKLSDFRSRMDQLNLESQVGGRISIADQGSKPYVPFRDRRAPFALLGGLGGMGLGFAIMLVVGLVNRKVRNMTDFEQRAPDDRLLGVIPELPALGGPGEESILAGHCLHHVRALLHLDAAEAGRVVVVTSPTAGAGKTTLSLGLGLSFATTGSRTLVIDCDLVGAGLTYSLTKLLRRRAEQLLDGPDARAANPLEDDLVADLLAAAGSAPPGGEIEGLLERAETLLPERADDSREAERLLRDVKRLERAFERRDADEDPAARSGTNGYAYGVLDALRGKPLAECVMNGGTPSLDVLSVGTARPRDAAKLSPRAMRALFETCRAAYDTVIVDTGPILGSLEASLVTSEADRVVLTVARGDERRLSREALERLESVGARLAGVVFNRADVVEVMRSSYSTHSRSVRSVPR